MIDDGVRQVAIARIKAELARRERIAKDRQDLAERLDEIRENCKSLHGFTAEAWHVLEPTTEFRDNWHLSAICDHLEGVYRKEIPFLVINLPPGMMKSMTVSVLFNPWEWGPGAKPGLRYITASYREDLTIRDSRKSRNLIQSEWYQTLWPNVKLIRKGDSEFENSFFGRRKAVPFMSLTGDRGNRVVIDDPHSLKQAESEVERPATVQLFREMVPSRVNDSMTDSIIVMMQRTHPEDICGVLDELNIPNVVKLILPMEYVPSMTVQTSWFSPTLGKQMGFKDPRQKLGDRLHPERITAEKLASDKILYGAHAYDTQFQQQPRARDGSYFFSRSHLLIKSKDKDGNDTQAPAQPRQVDAVLSVIDTASKKGAKRDGTGVGYIGYCEFPKPHGFILDWDVIQIEAAMLDEWLPSTLKRNEELAREYKARGGNQGAWIEDKDSGVALIQASQKKRLPVQAIPSELTALGKEGRALSVSGYANNGLMKITQHAWDKVTLYKGRSKNHFVDQVTTFRMGHGTPLDEDELFDVWCYGLALCFGDQKGL